MADNEVPVMFFILCKEDWTPFDCVTNLEEYQGIEIFAVNVKTEGMIPLMPWPWLGQPSVTGLLERASAAYNKKVLEERAKKRARGEEEEGL